MTALSCAAARELAPDLALGDLSGDDRARLLIHLAGCPGCESLVSDLTGVVDRLLILTPEEEPPPGFETAVLQRIASVRQAPAAHVALSPIQRLTATRRGRMLALAAAVVVLAGTVGGTIALQRRNPPSGLTRQYVAALAAMGGQDLRAGTLVGERGLEWGQAFAYQGDTSWVFVTMRWDVPDGDYTVLLDRTNGSSMPISTVRLRDGEGSTGHSVGETRDVRAVRVVDASGHTLCTARLPPDPA